MKTDIAQFDPTNVAKIDAAMWRSYYNHQFYKLFWQLLTLIKAQLGLSWLVTIRLAYYSAWAAADYRIRKHTGVNHSRVLANLTKFYELISRHSVKRFDYKRAAELELAWWDVHRSSTTNNKVLEQSLANNMAAIYNVAPEKLADYAHYRAEAMILPRHEGDDQPVATDWDNVESLLIKAWASLYSAIQ